MASQWATPPPGYPAVHGQAYGNQQLATPPPQAATAVAVTATSNGVGNPYVVVTPASATPSTGQSKYAPESALAHLLRPLQVI
jgi:hypothetical protein